ncbi:MAG TPA: hypothetical protein VN522_08205 [Solirubrobacterales bacterium]|nr:hypothetical protein [Solirubrobacterales bacterium]
MKAFYDSEGDALQIHFTEPPRIGYAEDVDGAACFVEIDDGDEKVGVELLWTTKHLELLDAAAEKYDLDARALKAVAAAAMAAPMSYVTVEVGERVADEEAQAA